MTHEWKTLKELDVKPGDVVVNEDGSRGVIDNTLVWFGDKGEYVMVGQSLLQCWRIISRASDTPKVWRDMTREEKGAVPAEVLNDPTNPLCVPWGEWADAAKVKLLMSFHDRGSIETFASTGEWLVVRSPLWVLDYAYRVRPEPEPTPMVVPWEALADWVMHAARREDGFIFGYELKPREEENDWVTVGGRVVSLVAVKIDPGTCDWRDSLQKRPEGA